MAIVAKPRHSSRCKAAPSTIFTTSKTGRSSSIAGSSSSPWSRKRSARTFSETVAWLPGILRRAAIVGFCACKVVLVDCVEGLHHEALEDGLLLVPMGDDVRQAIDAAYQG